ncbi:MAG: KamA family radical SAM protein [Hydrogenothermaceae bacterium]|nr:KamA family radical SAM protein [Hydrogenothermaceae bacterium]
MRILQDSYWKSFEKWKNIDRDNWFNWKWQTANRIKSLEDLKSIVKWVDEREFYQVNTLFHFATTPYYLSLADITNPEDPILKQVIPSKQEIDEEYQKEAELDPFLEDIKSPVPGLTYRYPDRVLMRTTNVCSVYCRHCMRKRMFLEEERAKTKEEFEIMFEYIKKNKNIKEVLISGGDPLTLPNKKIDYILENLQYIDHIDVIRIGTRDVVVNPFRFFDENLLEILSKYDKIWIVTHFNHPNEITNYTKQAVKNILQTGIPVLNQTVLLKGVNDDKFLIEELMRDLLKVKIKPYYLFHCDPVKGVYHFKTGIDKGLEIMEHLRGRLSGIGIPTFALDLNGGLGKIPLLPEYIVEKGGKYIKFRNYENKEVIIKNL